MENKPCKLTFQHWDETVSIEKNYSDITVDEFFEMCKQVALAAGFSRKNIKEYFEQ
jgi:hypothetical protein